MPALRVASCAMRSVWLIAAATCVMGCAPSTNFKRPATDLPSAYRAAEQETAADRTLAEYGWWDVYQDKTLTALIRRALERNRDLRLAAARVAEARATLGIAEYGPLPSLSAGASYTPSRVSQVAAQPIAPGLTEYRRSWRATIDASYEVDFWGRLSALSEAAKADVYALEFARETVMATLVGDIATAYFDLLALDQQLAISESTIATRQRFLDLTRSRLRLGVATKLDVDRAQANLSAVQATIPDLRRRIAQGENLLAFLSGATLGPLERDKPELDRVVEPPSVPAGLPSKLLERRPDVRQAEQAIVGANARLASQRAALLPSFSLTGQFGSDARELAGFLTAPSRLWSLGTGILMPILNAQRNRYQVDAAAAREVQAIEQYQRVVEQSIREVADSLIARRDFYEVQTALREQAKALRDVNRVVLQRYEAGVSSYFEVIDAQRDHLAAELALSQAQRNLLVSSVQLYKALGGGWQRDDVPETRPAVPAPKS